jgi:hypothetical protein
MDLDESGHAPVVCRTYRVNFGHYLWPATLGEDLGRGPRYLGPSIHDAYDSVTPLATSLPSVNQADPGPAGRYAQYRRFWRWAEPDECFGVSGTPNNRYRLEDEPSAWTETGPFVAQGNQAGTNDELASFHPGGVNGLVGDGSVRFPKDSVNPITPRALVTPHGGEVISSDSY